MPSLTLKKDERIHGKTTVSKLLAEGRWGKTSHLRYCYLVNAPGEDGSIQGSRIMVSVPKKLFKRAVKRNLLKRRLRESYRTQKELLTSAGTDILFSYNHNEVLDYATIREEVASVLGAVSEKAAAK